MSACLHKVCEENEALRRWKSIQEPNCTCACTILALSASSSILSFARSQDRSNDSRLREACLRKHEQIRLAACCRTCFGLLSDEDTRLGNSKLHVHVCSLGAAPAAANDSLTWCPWCRWCRRSPRATSPRATSTSKPRGGAGTQRHPSSFFAKRFALYLTVVQLSGGYEIVCVAPTLVMAGGGRGYCCEL